MDSFKEWLSDYLRYFILGLAMVLAIIVIVLGIRLYQNSQDAQQTQGNRADIEILTELQTAPETKEGETEETTEDSGEGETEPQTSPLILTEKPEEETGRQSETQGAENMRDTSGQITERPKQTETGTTEKTRETKSQETKPTGTKSTESGTRQTEQPQTEQRQTEQPQTERRQTEQPQTERRQTEQPQTEQRQTDPPQTDPPQTEPPQPVYMTMTGTCYFRSYADYGDNIIGEYPAGTVVEFLEDAGGWYKVQIDGMVGYMGARFFQ